MAWIQPLELESFIVNILSEDLKIFTILGLLFVFGLSAYFRMNMLSMFFMTGLFLVIFSSFVSQPIYFLLITFAGLAAGYVISRYVWK